MVVYGVRWYVGCEVCCVRWCVECEVVCGGVCRVLCGGVGGHNSLCFGPGLHILKPHDVGYEGEVPQQQPVRHTVPHQPGKERCEHKLRI